MARLSYTTTDGEQVVVEATAITIADGGEDDQIVVAKCHLLAIASILLADACHLAVNDSSIEPRDWIGISLPASSTPVPSRIASGVLIADD